MKQINGTVTLAFLEEDNKQRVIFRIVPLCTREGLLFRDNQSEFPDEGSLRVVPDKREQSTFKERMRAMGFLCAISLGTDGKELAKVRVNRNYDPAQGEKNQYAIYSDVISEFAPNGLFEVLDLSVGGCSAQRLGAVLTPMVLLQQSKVLYGPVPVGEAEAAAKSLSSLRPFGNDHFLLHTVTLPDQTAHAVYWDPDATINWRQRRGSLRRKTEAEEKAPAPPQAKPEEAARSVCPPAETPKPALPAKTELAAPAAADAPAGPAVLAEASKKPALKETPKKPAFEKNAVLSDLPIGARLDILDSTISFEQQLDQLDQPLSKSANRLSSAQEPIAPPAGGPARFCGTPLFRPSAAPQRTGRRGDTLHQVVELQLRATRDAQPGAELRQNADVQPVENPVETVQQLINRTWQDPDTRESMIRALLGNDSFMRYFVKAARKSGCELSAMAAAQEQLAEIEAERLSLLMQLESAKEEQRQRDAETLRRLTQKQRAELAELDQLVAQRTEQLKALEKGIEDLDALAHDKLTEYLSGSAGSEMVTLCPRTGKVYAMPEMAEAVRATLQAQGFSISPDDALTLMIDFSLFDTLNFCGESMADARLFAKTFLRALCLTEVSACVLPQTQLRFADLLPDNPLRTPTVAVAEGAFPNVLHAGHKTLCLFVGYGSDESVPCPALHVPPLATALREGAGKPLEQPIALASLSGLQDQISPLLQDSEKWFEELEDDLSVSAADIPKASLQEMRKYVSVASGDLRGGFLAAVDSAVCQWVLPRLLCLGVKPELVARSLMGLPKAMTRMNVSSVE